MTSINSGCASDGTPRYVVNYRDPASGLRHQSIRREAAVERVRNRVEADQARGTYLDVDARRVTFAVFAAEWVATRTFNLSTHEATELRLPLHVLPLTGGWSCDKSPVHHQKLPRPMDLSDTCKRVTLVKGLGRPRTAVDGEKIEGPVQGVLSEGPPRRSPVTTCIPSFRPCEWCTDGMRPYDRPEGRAFMATTDVPIPGDDAHLPDRLLTPAEVAEYLGVPEKTLAQWRSDRHGPLPLRIGRYVRYRLCDIQIWVDEQATAARRWMAS